MVERTKQSLLSSAVNLFLSSLLFKLECKQGFLECRVISIILSSIFSFHIPLTSETDHVFWYSIVWIRKEGIKHLFPLFGLFDYGAIALSDTYHCCPLIVELPLALWVRSTSVSSEEPVESVKRVKRHGSTRPADDASVLIIRCVWVTVTAAAN